MIRDEIEEKIKSKVNQIAIKRMRTKFDTKDKRKDVIVLWK
jgi:hypothetical protein